jgi:hypothetical protein
MPSEGLPASKISLRREDCAYDLCANCLDSVRGQLPEKAPPIAKVIKKTAPPLPKVETTTKHVDFHQHPLTLSLVDENWTCLSPSCRSKKTDLNLNPFHVRRYLCVACWPKKQLNLCEFCLHDEPAPCEVTSHPHPLFSHSVRAVACSTCHAISPASTEVLYYACDECTIEMCEACVLSSLLPQNTTPRNEWPGIDETDFTKMYTFAAMIPPPLGQIYNVKWHGGGKEEKARRALLVLHAEEFFVKASWTNEILLASTAYSQVTRCVLFFRLLFIGLLFISFFFISLLVS